jgi:hypothetical protein
MHNRRAHAAAAAAGNAGSLAPYDSHGSGGPASAESLPPNAERSTATSEMLLALPAARPFTATRPSAGAGALVPATDAPWQSPAVVALATRIGRGDPSATPMIVEGRTGTVLAAVGTQQDHKAAGAAISQSMAAQLGPKLERAEQMKPVVKPPASNHAGCSSSSAGRASAPRAARGAAAPPPAPTTLAVRKPAGGVLAAHAPEAPQASFGAVYEYRDARGKPVFVGETGQRAEAAFKADYQEHRPVRALAQQGGSASVVWAGCGHGPCGPTEMAAAREAVAHDRAQRQRIGELTSAKPYSAHSHLMLQ